MLAASDTRCFYTHLVKYFYSYQNKPPLVPLSLCALVLVQFVFYLCNHKHILQAKKATCGRGCDTDRQSSTQIGPDVAVPINQKKKVDIQETTQYVTGCI